MDGLRGTGVTLSSDVNLNKGYTVNTAVVNPVNYRIAYRILGNDQDAFDAVQEAALKLVKGGINKYDSTKPLAPWIGTIVANTARDLRDANNSRGRRYMEELISENGVSALENMPGKESRAALEDNLEGKEEKQRLFEKWTDAFYCLTPHMQEVVRRHIIEGKSYEDIALEIGNSPISIKTCFHGAREKMKRVLGGGKSVKPRSTNIDEHLLRSRELANDFLASFL